MIDERMTPVLSECARQLVEIADIVSEMSEEERRFFRDEIAKEARDKPSRTSVFNLAALLRWAWGDALWRRD